MKYFFTFLLCISWISYIYTQKFEEESPFMLIRLMDVKLHEWKPGMLDRMEKELDEELKYSDAKKGVECRSIDFEQEAGYPQQNDRFLDLSVRGLCTDENGKVHDINKELMIVAIERQIDDVNRLVGGTVFRVGNVQIYKRNRNRLNLIIIPIAVGLTVFLFILTFILRRIRYAQKRRHIVTELEKKKDANTKKTQTIANIDPNASEKQRLLQLDPNVVGNASNIVGSPKEFTNEQYSSPTRNNRGFQEGPPPIPSKENRPPYHNIDNSQRSSKPSRERTHVPYENESRFSPIQSQHPYEPQHPDMIPMQEQQPRVVVRTIRGDDSHPQQYQQQEQTSGGYVPIPVQVERTGPHQRYVPPPYHSDPYYRQSNA